MRDFQRQIEDMLRRAPVHHWFRYQGFNFLDLYDVLKKLTCVHQVDSNWLVMPFLRNAVFAQAFRACLSDGEHGRKNYIAMPGATEKHWTMILVDHQAQVVEHWDSRGDTKALKHPWIQRRLKTILTILHAEFGAVYHVKNVVNIGHQVQDRNCGLFAIRFMEQKMKGIPTKDIVRSLNYDIDSVKSRYHLIRCTSEEGVSKAPWLYRKDPFRLRTQQQRLSWLDLVKLKILVS